ncbi:MAG TPA: DUF998 domain-containing protein [Polyangiaceae bacterium]|nr:DUF998 domain-containing protein [Polyangiaceae bacterium]
MIRKLLLLSGMLASLLYVGIDVLAAVRYPEYHSFSGQMVSELMAKGAPTERLVDPLFLLYGALMLGFAVGVWLSGTRGRVRVTGGLLFAYAATGLLGPTLYEMNVRGSGGDPSADIWHIALTAVLVVFIVAAVATGASLHGRPFRLYSFATLLIMAGFGALTSFAARGLSAGAPTPWLGLAERVDIGAFLVWVAVLGASLLRTPSGAPAAARTLAGREAPSLAPALGRGGAGV